MSNYYSFANNKPLIERNSLKKLYHDLKYYYNNAGQVKIVDSTGTIIREMFLTGKSSINEMIPNPRLLGALTNVSKDQRDVLVPTKYGVGEPPKITYTLPVN